MNLSELITEIHSIDHALRQRAVSVLNSALTMRNWLVGAYLVEYEQEGSDRAEYGKGLLKVVAKDLKSKRLKGMSVPQLECMARLCALHPKAGESIATSGVQKSATLSRILGAQEAGEGKSSTASRISSGSQSKGDLLLELPSPEEIQAFLEADRARIEASLKF